MKVFFSAGEASGDMHAATVARALKEQCPTVTMLGMGGEKMKEAGVDLVYDIDKLGYIGFVEILKALPTFFKLRSYLKKVLQEERPDVFVCVDYPGFNMKMAKVAYELGIPVVYYICPTIWAWHKSRGKVIAKYVSRVASIFPFEAEAYREFNAPVTFVGHPLVDTVQPTVSKEETMSKYGAQEEAIRILLMPGSRLQEVDSLLDIMLQSMEIVQKQLAHKGQKAQVFLPRAHTIPRALLEAKKEAFSVPIVITEGDNYNVMNICHVALAASGTATLETALMNLPTILVYKVAPLSYIIGKQLIQIDHVGLPNIVAHKEVIPELLQKDVNPQRISQEILRLIEDKAYYSEMKEELSHIKDALGEGGATQKVASLIIDLAQSEVLHEHL